MVEGDLTLDTSLQVELVGAENPGDLFHRGLDLTIGRRVVGVGVFLLQLVEVLDLQPCLRKCVFEELQNRRLVVRAQGQSCVA